MYPTKSVMDYMTEMNRLFPRIGENDYLPSTPSTSQSVNQSIRSSSSTDTSPESFPEFPRGSFPTGPVFQSPVRPNQSPARPDQIIPRLGDSQRMDYLCIAIENDSAFMPQSMFDTPPVLRQQRPIVGRKILTGDHSLDESNICFEELQHTPPNTRMNSFYELFPTERTEFKPVQDRSPSNLDFKANMRSRKYVQMSNDTASKYQQMSNDTSFGYQGMSNDTSPKYALMSDATSRYQQMSNETSPNYQQMSNDTIAKYGSMSDASPRYQQMSKDTSPSYQQMSNDTIAKYAPMSDTGPRYQQMSKDTSPSYQQMSNDITKYAPMSDASPRYQQMSNDFSPNYVMSREMSPIKLSPISTRSNTSMSSRRFSRPFKEPIVTPSTSRHDENKMCTFCRKNGETALVYMTHKVKEKVGNKNVVTCPILRSHVCSMCGASGDDAHTISYCPVLRSTNNGQPLPSTTITLKNTRVKSNGKRRY